MLTNALLSSDNLQHKRNKHGQMASRDVKWIKFPHVIDMIMEMFGLGLVDAVIKYLSSVFPFACCPCNSGARLVKGLKLRTVIGDNVSVWGWLLNHASGLMLALGNTLCRLDLDFLSG